MYNIELFDNGNNWIETIANADFKHIFKVARFIFRGYTQGSFYANVYRDRYFIGRIASYNGLVIYTRGTDLKQVVLREL